MLTSYLWKEMLRKFCLLLGSYSLDVARVNAFANHGIPFVRQEIPNPHILQRSIDEIKISESLI